MARTKKQTDPTCHWAHETDHDQDYWDTECGNAACFIDGGPRENHYQFCPYCGRTIKARESVETR